MPHERTRRRGGAACASGSGPTGGASSRRSMVKIASRAATSLAEALRRPSLAGCRFLDAGCGGGLFRVPRGASGVRGVVRLHPGIGRLRQSPADARRKQRRLVGPGRIGPPRRVPRIPRDVRRRLFVGCAPPHRCPLGRASAGGGARRARRGALHVDLQRSRMGEPRVARSQDDLQPASARPALRRRRSLARRPLGTAPRRRDVAGTSGRAWNAYARSSRGMSPWRDVVDWVGGLLFEVARVPTRCSVPCRDRGSSFVP